MDIRKLTVTAGITALVMASTVPAYAVSPAERRAEIESKKQEVQEKRQELREKVMGKIQELKDKSASNPGLLKQLLNKAAALKGTLVSVGTGSIVVKTDSKEVTVAVDGKTQIRYRFWGKGELAKMKAGDSMVVIGKWADETQTKLNATLIRDLSVQRRAGVFFGTVKETSANGWVLESKNRGTLTVTLAPNAKIVDRKEKPLTASDVKAGQWIRVKGVWDSQAKTVDSVTQVKDYSLPEKAKTEETESNEAKTTVSPSTTPSVTPVTTVTPTVTPTPTSSPTPTPTGTSST